MKTLTLRIVVLTAAAVAAVGTSTADAAKKPKPKRTTCTLTAAPSSAATGMTVPFRGKVGPRRVRKVLLQQRVGKRWMPRATAKSSRRGAFAFKVKLNTAGTAKWRVLVAKTSRFKGATCSSVNVTVTTGTGSTEMGNDMPGGTTGPGTGGPTDPPTDPPATGTQAPNTFRAIYAVASDETPIAGRTAAIAANIKAVNGWYASQTTGNVQPRWIRSSDGEIAVTTVKLANPASYYDGPDATNRVRTDVLAASPATASPQKMVVWIEGGMTVSGCGVTGSNISIIYRARCDITPDASDTFPFGATYLLAHEMTHNFGAVPSCAPHSGGGGHSNDDPRDVLYQGPQPRDWNNQMLDPGHDDYYATGNAACPGIEASPFWTATADPLS